MRKNQVFPCVFVLWLGLISGLSAEPFQETEDITISPDFCSLYPLTISQEILAGAQSGQSFSRVPLGSGTGNYSWLTWQGKPNTPSIVESLTPPGNSHTYRNPHDKLDGQLNLSDWVQGAPGVKNARHIREGLNALLGHNVIIPTWDLDRGQGAQKDYLTAKFAVVRLNEYKLSGKGYISFTFLRYTRCYNHRPVATDATITTDEDTPITFGLPVEDADPDTLNVHLLATPEHGEFSLDDTNITYTPKANYFGDDVLRFYVDDGEQRSESASVNLVIRPVNDAPVAQAGQSSGDEDHVQILHFAGTDVENAPLTFQPVTQPTHGSVAQVSGKWRYTPEANYFGEDQLTYVANDGDIDSEPVTYQLTINPVNDSPVAEDRHSNGQEDQPIHVTFGGLDVDGDPLTFTPISQPSNGTLSWDGQSWVYAPAPNFFGSDQFAYVANDGELDSNGARYTLAIEAVNDAPTAEDIRVETDAGEAIILPLVGNDIDSEDLTYLVDHPVHGELSGTAPNIVYTADTKFGGTEMLTYRVSDGELTSEPATIEIIVHQRNEAPTITSTPPVSTSEGVIYTYSVQASDPDGDTLSYSLDSAPNGMSIGENDGVLEWAASSADFTDPRSETNPWCVVEPDQQTDSLNPVVKWHWQGHEKYPNFNQVMMTPVVGQLNDDNGDGLIDKSDQTDIVFSTFELGSAEGASAPGYIRIVSGNNGKNLITIETQIDAYASLALADIDQDGSPEILAPRLGGALAAFEHDGTLKWEIPTSRANNYHGATVADLDADGSPEILWNGAVYDNSGKLKWKAGSGYIGGRTSHGGFGVAVDLDLDGHQEVLFGASAYTASGRLLWKNETIGDAFTGFANFDADLAPEIILVGNGSVTLLDTDGTVVWKTSIPGGGFGGAPTIADFDGDGRIEVGVAGARRYAVFEDTGELLWGSTTEDESSNFTGSSLFDFNGDGTAEVVYGDEYYLRIYNGADGQILHQLRNTSATTFEMPIVADVDNDGRAELVAVSNQFLQHHFNRPLDNTTQGLRVFESASDSWLPTRRIWNQHAYNISNINDDLSVPASPNKSWQGHNTFRLNTFADRDALAAPDLLVHGITYLDDSQTLTLRVSNRGMAPVLDTVDVSVTNDSGAEIGHVSLRGLASGESKEASFAVTVEQLGDVVNANVSASDDVKECESANNVTSAAVVTVKAEDDGNLYDNQTFTAYFLPENTKPNIESSAFSEAEETEAYQFQVRAYDPDVGDAITYSLFNAPEGLSIDARTGVMSVSVLSQGTYRFTVRAIDLAGTFDEQLHTLTVSETDAINEPPSITSGPVSTVTEGEQYDYLLEARDPNWGDQLSYDLVASPEGMRIDPAIGRINWLAAGIQNPLSSTNTACYGKVEVDFEAGDPTLKWHWEGQSGPDRSYNQVMHAPIAVPLSDTNGDGRVTDRDDIAIIFQTFRSSSYRYPGYLRAIDGKTGEHLWTSAERIIHPGTNPAAADIDGDGYVEIITGLSGGGIVAYSHDGVEEWRSVSTKSVGSGGPSIADINNDGVPEIVVGNTVYDNLGNELFKGTGSNGSNLSIVADIDLDGEVEIIAGGAVYSNIGELEFDNGEGTAALGNFDDDPEAEIVVIRQGKLSLYNHDGSEIWRDVPLGSTGNGGPPTVADLTGNGVPEIGVALGGLYVVTDANGERVWASYTQDRSSHSTGSAVFDFDADGRMEVVYADELNLRIYDGPTGDILYRIPNSSGTLRELPIVADVDNDGHAELVVISNSYRFRISAGIRVFEDVNDAWAPTRTIWNQHAYNVNNINDDLTVPSLPAPSWLSHNTFRLNTFPDRDARAISDLVVEHISYNSSTNTVSAKVKNRGLAPLSAPFDVQIEHSAEGSATLLGTLSGEYLAAGESTTLSLAAAEPLRSGEISARIVVSEANLECDDLNNISRSPLVTAVVSDDKGLKDQQTFALYVDPLNHPPMIESAASSHGKESEAYRFEVQVADEDIGDAVIYSLNSVQGEFKIDPITGVISAAFIPEGTYSFTIIATDLAGASSKQEHTVTIAGLSEPPSDNNPPVFASSPVTVVKAGELYLYQTEVYDPEGESVELSIDSDLQGMMISEQGLLQWQTTEAQVGNHEIFVIASDGETTSRQRFVLTVLGENQPPEVQSTPALEATVGHSYIYALVASDPDGDELSYSLETAPEGMSISSEGRVNWTPDITQVGIQDVSVVVSDGLNSLTQSFSVTVADGNAAPSITSSPIGEATIGQPYRYAVAASDPDNDPLGFGITEGPSGMSISGAGVLDWIPEDDQIGQFPVTVTVTDGKSTVGQSFILTATKINRPPEITSSPINKAIIGQPYQYTVAASDPDSDALSFGITEGPSGMTISAAGVLDWIPEEGQIGKFPVTVTVTDGKSTVSQSFILTSGETNSPPEITSTPVLVAQIEQPYTYAVQAVDADTDELTYSLLSSPAGMIVSNSGLITWTPTEPQAGVHNVSVSVSDGLSEVSQSFSVTVSRQLGTPPSISSSPIQSATAGEVYDYQIVASDPDGDPITYALNQAPPGMTLSDQGLLSWIPAATQVGPHSVVLAASDGKDGTATQSFTLRVLESASRLPYLANTPKTEAIVGQQYVYRVAAVDAEGYSAEVALISGPEGMTLDKSLSPPALQWTPAEGNCSHEVTLRLTDYRDQSVEVQFTIRVIQAPKKHNRIQCSKQNGACSAQP